jgi:HEAT repeat protein
MYDGEDLLTDEQFSRPAKRPVEDVLDQLISHPEAPELPDLYAFSDLSLRDTQRVRENWTVIPVERRRGLVRALVDAAHDDLDLHLGRLLRIAIKDEDAQVREAAVNGLWEDISGDLVGDLVHILYHDPEVAVRSVAAKALGSYILAGELDELEASLAMRVENALLDVVEGEQEPLVVRCRALESIAYSGEVGVRQLLEDAYYAPEEEMRVSALVAMGRSADIRWRGLIRAELQNPSTDMRTAAAVACGELEASAARDELIALLEDPVREVRLAAIFALGRIGGDDAVDALQAVIVGGDEEEVEAAEMALEELAFYTDSEISLFDEEFEEEDDWYFDPWDDWSDIDDSDLGTYE